MATDARLRLKELFAAAVALTPEARAHFLDDVCSGEPAVRVEIESLLRDSDLAGDFLEQPIALDTFGDLGLPRPAPVEHLEPHRRLGPYEILEPLAAGGMGQVYRARDVRLDRVVALKVLPAATAGDAEVRRRFEQEARAIAKLNHPNICALYDVGRQDDVDFLVMEYLEGETLAQRLGQGPMPSHTLIRCGIEIADALDRAHRLGVIHRDLKPSNIILTESGAKLLDFGIAKLLHRDAEGDRAAPAGIDLTLTQGGRIIGTVAYMSPEQVRGEPIDQRSDLFSLGAVLYEMAVGRRPFTGVNADAICEAILKGAPPIDTSMPERPLRLRVIISKALETDRTKRYQRAFDIKTDLQAIERTADASTDVGRRGKGFKQVASLAVAATLAASGYLLVRDRHIRTVTTSERQSVAVLPFKPLAAAADDNYMGVALAEALITELGAFKTIAVRPLSASSRYGVGADRDPVTAGRELGVALVLDGAIQRSADRLRVNVSLIRVSDGLTMWTDRFDSPWIDVFRVQDAIAEHVGRALAAALSGEGRQRVIRRRPDNLAAYEAYLKGRHFWNMRTIDALQRALVYFQQAIDTDRTYAPAYAGLADTYAMLGSMPYAVMPGWEAAAKAKTAAKKALEIDDTLAEAHGSLAFVTYAFDWQWPDAGREFQRAIQLDPNYQAARLWYAGYLALIGRVHEGIVEAERSRALDPLSLIGTYQVGLMYYFARQYDTAEEYARKTLEIDANFPSARRLLAQVYAAQGRHAEALVEFQRLSEMSRGNWLHTALLAQAYGCANDPVNARQILADMITASQTRYVPPAQIAMGYIGLGDRDAAFAWLERAYAEHSQVLTFVKMDPMFDSLRSDPRYGDLIRRIGLDAKEPFPVQTHLLNPSAGTPSSRCSG